MKSENIPINERRKIYKSNLPWYGRVLLSSCAFAVRQIPDQTVLGIVQNALRYKMYFVNAIKLKKSLVLYLPVCYDL